MQQTFNDLRTEGDCAQDEDHVADGAEPAQAVDDRILFDKFRTARPPQTFVDGGIRLDDANRQQAGEEHQRKAKVH